MKTIMIAILLMVSFNTSATTEAFCEELSQVATLTMTYRQLGKPAAELFKMINKETTDQYERRMYKEIIIEAYEVPRFTTPRVVEKVISKHGNDWYIQCIKIVLERGDNGSATIRNRTN